MNASILDLRYKIKEVLIALSRRETVRILYRGSVKGEIIPAGSKSKNRTSEHPLFGMLKSEKKILLILLIKCVKHVIMIFDTDILIWIQRGNQKAAELVDSVEWYFKPIKYLQFKMFKVQ